MGNWLSPFDRDEGEIKALPACRVTHKKTAALHGHTAGDIKDGHIQVWLLIEEQSEPALDFIQSLFPQATVRKQAYLYLKVPLDDVDFT